MGASTIHAASPILDTFGNTYVTVPITFNTARRPDTLGYLTRRQTSPISNQQKQSTYIPKLHLKMSELRNVLCDINVQIILSGTFTSCNLCMCILFIYVIYNM